MSPYNIYYQTLAETTIKNLQKRQMEGYYCNTAKEAVEKANSLLIDGATISFGGSVTLQETGMLDSLRSNPGITLLDRDQAKSNDEKQAIFHKSFGADYYFMSSNAITADGKLVNIDGTGNRLAALIYGPKNVIILAGMNKVVKDEQDGLSRVRLTAAAPNAIRLNRKTPCAITGVCSDCLSLDCICNQIIITRRSGIEGRIKVILIGESYGY